MNYIYDVLLNFKPILYDFYEWNMQDDILHIRRIPIIKIDKQDLEKLKNCRIKIEGDFLNRFKNKAEVFQRKSIQTLDCAMIFTDGKEAMGAEFIEKELVFKSKLLLDEEEDVLEIATTLPFSQLHYKVIKENKKNPFHTRKEDEMEKYIFKEIRKKENEEKLKYIYFECFNEKAEKDTPIVKCIYESLIDNFDIFAHKIYDVLKLTSAKK